MQTKLTINEPRDTYEQEADRIADQVMAVPLNSKVGDLPRSIQRLSGDPVGPTDTVSASVDHTLASPGKPLEPSLLHDMEQCFGYNFSHVRVHIGTDAEQSARDVNARAYTLGQDIVFGEGGLSSGTHEGRRLIAHELVHVLQQQEKRVTGQLIQRDLHEDIQALLGRRMPAPMTALDRERNIQALLDMERPLSESEESRRLVMERRRLFWEVCRLIDDPAEAERLHNRLAEGDLSESFQFGFATAVRDTFLRLLRGRYRPGQLAVEAAETFPSASFGSFTSWLRFNPEYWTVSYSFQLVGQPLLRWESTNEQIVFSSDPSLRRIPTELDQSDPHDIEEIVVPRHVNRVMTASPSVQWSTRYSGPVIEISVGQRGPEAAINDLWTNADARHLYAFDCYVAAALTELMGIYSHYVEEDMVDEFNASYQTFRIIRTPESMQTTLIGQGLVPIASSPSIRELPPEHRIPIAAQERWQHIIRPGDWVVIHNTFFQPGSLWENENAVYLGGNRFFGFGAVPPVFTLEEYAHELYKPYLLPNAQRGQTQPTDWLQSDSPSNWISHLITFWREGVPYPFELRRPWNEVRGQVISFVGANSVLIPRARSRVEVQPSISFR